MIGAVVAFAVAAVYVVIALVSVAAAQQLALVYLVFLLTWLVQTERRRRC